MITTINAPTATVESLAKVGEQRFVTFIQLDSSPPGLGWVGVGSIAAPPLRIVPSKASNQIPLDLQTLIDFRRLVHGLGL